MNERRDVIENYCESNSNFFGGYKITRVEDNNAPGTYGYVIQYGLDTNEPAYMIIPPTANLSDLSGVVELEPATGQYINGVAQPTTADQTYESYISGGKINTTDYLTHEDSEQLSLTGVLGGDFSRVPSNTVVSIPHMYTEEYDGSLAAACKLVKHWGGEITDIGTLSVSGSGGSALRKLANLVLSGEYTDANFRCAHFDSYNEEEFFTFLSNCSDDQLELLTSKLEIINFFPDEESAARALGYNWGRFGNKEDAKSSGNSKPLIYILKKLEEAGFNSSFFQVNEKGEVDIQHAMFLYLALYGTNSLEHLAGIDDEIYDTERWGELWGLIGNRKILNVETGEYMVLEYDSDIMNKYKGLKNIEPCRLYRPGVLSSNLVFVIQSMNEIKNSIKNQSFLSSLKGMNFQNSDPNGVPGCLMGVIGEAFDAVGALMSSLADETDAIISFAEGLDEMDKDIASKVPGSGA